VSGLWIFGGLTAALAAAAAVTTVAAILLMRDNTRLERLAQGAADDAEKLRDELWHIADSEERHRSLVEAQGDLIVRRRGDGEVLFANHAYRALFGEVSSYATQGSSHIVVSDRSEMREDGTRVVDEEIRLADGSTRWISWVETAVRDQAGGSALQRVGRDMTARIIAESALREAHARAEEASEAKSRFLATVSHEFRTPLNGILGMAELMGDTHLDAEQRAYLAALKASGEALLNQVEEILDFAKVEAGRIALSNEPFDLVRVIEDVVELIAPRAQEKALDIAACIAPVTGLRRIGDPEKLRQILVNLVGNAVKFTQEGHVSVSLEATDAEIRITVADSGPGIQPDRLEAIFIEFEQASVDIGRLHGGTGLGLPIARRLAEAMGGSLGVESEPGQGSAFHVTLPLPSFAEEAGAAPRAWAGQSILLVGAGPALSRAIEARAQAGGGQCRAVGVGEAAAAIGRGGFNAVVVDLAVGAELARALAGLAQRCGVTRRFIALTPFVLARRWSRALPGFWSSRRAAARSMCGWVDRSPRCRRTG
jgi:PAS domain S-box-containing protein